MSEDFFKGIMQWEIESTGLKGKLPVFYYDNTSMSAVYTAETGSVTRLLPHPAMHPVEIYPGRCLVALTAFEYRRTDIDPYNELSISIIIGFDRRPLPGVTILGQMMSRCFRAYILHLPVTTERARAGGVDLYGYPKFLAEITFRRERSFIECTLAERGSTILRMRGPVLETCRGKTIRYRTFSVKDGIPLCANVITNPIEFAQTMNGRSVELEIGPSHAISEELRKMELSRRPILYQYSPVNEAVLFGPRNLIDD
jgi:hypothetical protein